MAPFDRVCNFRRPQRPSSLCSSARKSMGLRKFQCHYVEVRYEPSARLSRLEDHWAVQGSAVNTPGFLLLLLRSSHITSTHLRSSNLFFLKLGLECFLSVLEKHANIRFYSLNPSVNNFDFSDCSKHCSYNHICGYSDRVQHPVFHSTEHCVKI